MPPRPVRSTQAGPSSNPAQSAPSSTPTPPPGSDLLSHRTEDSLSPAPSTPRQGPLPHASVEPEDFRLSEPAPASSEEVLELRALVDSLRRRLDVLPLLVRRDKPPSNKLLRTEKLLMRQPVTPPLLISLS
jgi:hypothetical protein